MSDVTVNVKGLDQLIKALKAKPPVVRIGILGSSPRNPKEGQKKAPTNAEIGAVHEFGSPARGIPERSFLRVPLSENLQKEMERTGALDKTTLREVVKSGSVIPWLKKVMVLAEGIVSEAFDTAGFGQWKPWSRGYTNNTGNILVDTQQLRNSITSEVKE